MLLEGAYPHQVDAALQGFGFAMGPFRMYDVVGIDLEWRARELAGQGQDDPLVQVDNVFVFPGIPSLLRAKFEGSRTRFEGSPVFLRHVYVTCIETDVALDLRQLLEAFPELMLGSYPQVGEDGYRTLVTLESRDEDYVSRAVDALLARIPADYVLRVE